MKKILFIMLILAFNVFSETFKERYDNTTDAFEKSMLLKEEFFNSVFVGNPIGVEECLKLGIPVDSGFYIKNKDESRRFTYASPLGYAVIQNDLRMVKLLLKYKANPNFKVDAEYYLFDPPIQYKESLLFIAKDKEIIKLLIEAGIDIFHLDYIASISDGWDGLFFSKELNSLYQSYYSDAFFSKEDEDYIKFLVNGGYSVNGILGPDLPFSHIIVSKGSLDLIEFFISHGTELTTSELAAASEAGRLDVVEYILKKLKK